MSRGRGRGQLTFNAELLGVGRGGGLEAAPQSVLAPPPKFPPRPQRIPLLVDDSEQEYLLAVRKELQTQFRASQFYIAPPPSASAEKNKYTVERYSDRFAVAKDATLNLCWNRLPKELRPETAAAAKRKKRKAASTKPNMVKRKTARESEDVSMALDELEKKEAGDAKSGDEAAVSSGDEGDKEKDDEGEKKDSDLEGEGDDGDEELDGGTDYANNFFDNGEGYLDDDDDNLDEGGIY